jgi:predicted signal transduction protein with EAL and GGDEF domain
MKDLNAIYNFKNGDYLIKQLNFILKNQAKQLIKESLKRNVEIKIKNTHADIFEILIFDNLSIEEIVVLKNVIYECVVANDFKLLNTNSTINIDVTIGCSKGIDKNIKIYAEKAVYNAKLNFLHYMYYDSILYKDEATNENLLETINYSIENNLVEPYFQAIMDNSNDKIIKYEALMRIFDKDGNMLMPNVFIHKAKKENLNYPLTRFELKLQKAFFFNNNLDSKTIINALNRYTVMYFQNTYEKNMIADRYNSYSRISKRDIERMGLVRYRLKPDVSKIERFIKSLKNYRLY